MWMSLYWNNTVGHFSLIASFETIFCKILITSSASNLKFGFRKIDFRFGTLSAAADSVTKRDNVK